MALAQEAIWALDLERVILVPTGRAPHKEIVGDPGAERRLKMTQLAAAGDDRLEVSALEVERPGLSYSALTLETLAAEWGDDVELHFVMGADAAVGLAGWHRPERVLELARPAVARRGDVPMDEVAAVMRHLGLKQPMTVLDMPPFGVSSSLIRERAANGMPIRYLVPDAVAAFIENEKVYVGGGESDN